MGLKSPKMLFLAFAAFFAFAFGRREPNYVKKLENDVQTKYLMENSDKLSAILFYKDQEEDCYWCDLNWETYLKVAKRLKNLIHFYHLNCDERLQYEGSGERDYTFH